uniref:Dishevelled associated activator of morphogenesis 1 n=1 Tax=Junco hyemalis TaxID=40217 RepID=A0A8C5NR69_JUNHY
MAPRKRSGRGISFIFCCFRSSEHPEITYRLRNDSSFALQTMEPSLPMPPVEELDAMFTELVGVCTIVWKKLAGDAPAGLLDLRVLCRVKLWRSITQAGKVPWVN